MTALVSVLFNEPKLLKSFERYDIKALNLGFSALQRAEIAEISAPPMDGSARYSVSVLFNEPKLLKFGLAALSRRQHVWFQCSSTSRNC